MACWFILPVFLAFLLSIALVGDQLMRNLELQSWFFVLCDLWVDEPALKWELLLGLETQLSRKPRTEASQPKVYTPGLVTFLRTCPLALGMVSGVGRAVRDGFLADAGSSSSCLFQGRPGCCSVWGTGIQNLKIPPPVEPRVVVVGSAPHLGLLVVVLG